MCALNFTYLKEAAGHIWPVGPSLLLCFRSVLYSVAEHLPEWACGHEPCIKSGTGEEHGPTGCPLQHSCSFAFDEKGTRCCFPSGLGKPSQWSLCIHTGDLSLLSCFLMGEDGVHSLPPRKNLGTPTDVRGTPNVTVPSTLPPASWWVPISVRGADVRSMVSFVRICSAFISV